MYSFVGHDGLFTILSFYVRRNSLHDTHQFTSADKNSVGNEIIQLQLI